MRFAVALLLLTPLFGAHSWLEFSGGKGPGRGKHIVLVSGDEEYRSEQSLPQLAQILATRHGFRTTVLFAIDRSTGKVNPDQRDNIPHLEALDSADLLILLTRFRDLPDEQMKHIYDYVQAGKPIVGLRTATHAFEIKTSPTYQTWTWNSKEPAGGFGQFVLGETWVSHHGQHGKQATRGRFPAKVNSELLNGIADGEIFGPSDVYTVKHLPEDARVVLSGEVVAGMTASDPAAEGVQNSPMMPIAWTRRYKGGRIFTTTMGASQDFENEGLRRLVVNAVYWCLGMRVPVKAEVDYVGAYKPTPFGFGKYIQGRSPEQYQ